MSHHIFRTTVPIVPSEVSITYEHAVLCIGSCFTEHIGEKLAYYKYPILTNPMGILFNPISILNGLSRVIQNTGYDAHSLYHTGDKWISWDHHSQFSHRDQEVVLNRIQEQLDQAHDRLQRCNYVFISWGTAWVYRWKNTGQVVANCHKVPAQHFDKKLLEVADIVLEYAKLIEKISEVHPQLKIVFTVSPVRHWKDGALENQVSKSTLRVAVHQLMQRFERVGYFPSYELMMDDLRDYRFYKSDMLHPNVVAIDYIWDRFCEGYIPETDQILHRRIGNIHQGLDHRPSDPHEQAYIRHLQKIQMQIYECAKERPEIDWEAEKKLLENLLKEHKSL